MNSQLYEKIQSGIYNIMEESLKQAAREYHRNLVGNIVQNIYNAPNSPYYDRTQNFLKSISQGFNLVIDASGEFEIQFADDRYIKAFNGKKGKFGHHKSFPWDDPYPTNSEVRENLFDWLNDGFTILGKRGHPGYHFDIPEEEFWGRFEELFKTKLVTFLREISKRGG